MNDGIDKMDLTLFRAALNRKLQDLERLIILRTYKGPKQCQ